MKKIIVFFADGFEEVEALTIVDYLRRVDIKVDMVSITNDLKVKGAHGVELLTDKLLADIDHSDYDGVIIPGGMPGASNLRDHGRVIEIIKDLNSQGKLVAAICAGPIVLNRADIIAGKNITAYPGFEEELAKSQLTGRPVEIDGNIITAMGPNFAVNFALELVKYLLAEEKLRELKAGILYD